MPDLIEINGEKIARGEDKQLNLRIARLPTYTNIDLHVRGVPDGKDINRSFPGSKTGFLAKLVTYTIMKKIIPIIDVGIDFHTGGSSRANLTQIRCVLNIEQNMDLARAFASPVTIHSGLIEKSFRKVAYKKRKHILVFETGESLRFDSNGIEEGINGTTLRLFKHFEMVNEAPNPHSSEIYEKSDWVRASFAGLYHPKIKLGDLVEKGMNLGSITDPFGNEKKLLKK